MRNEFSDEIIKVDKFEREFHVDSHIERFHYNSIASLC